MISASVRGDELVVRRFKAFPEKLHKELVVAVTRLGFRLEAKVKSEKLTNQVLNVRTGTLRRSIHSNVTQTPTRITGGVSTNVIYGAAHEYGVDKNVTVHAHLRNIKEAFGKSIAPKTVNVKSHSRHMVLPERSYMRSSLKEMNEAGVIDREIEAAVTRALTT